MVGVAEPRYAAACTGLGFGISGLGFGKAAGYRSFGFRVSETPQAAGCRKHAHVNTGAQGAKVLALAGRNQTHAATYTRTKHSQASKHQRDLLNPKPETRSST